MSQNSSRPVIIAGNWKMYKTIEEARVFIETLTPLIMKSQAAVYLAVPFTAIHPAVECVKELEAFIKIGAQNMNDASEGAFTGEIAGRMLIEAGAQFVILGHSERRHYFNESDELINRKIKRALLDHLQPLVCIGETLEQRDRGEVEEILKAQLKASLEGLSSEEVSSLILAYEPIWAIGTGKVAAPSDAQAAHKICRSMIEDLWGKQTAERLTILYGGSVKPENAADLINQEDVDGFLVGGASLSPQAFSQIVNVYQGASI